MKNVSPICPTCQTQMQPKKFDFVDYYDEEGPPVTDQPFPEYIYRTMYYNYFCPNCGTRIKQAFRTAKYEKPVITKLID